MCADTVVSVICLFAGLFIHLQIYIGVFIGLIILYLLFIFIVYYISGKFFLFVTLSTTFENLLFFFLEF